MKTLTKKLRDAIAMGNISEIKRYSLQVESRAKIVQQNFREAETEAKIESEKNKILTGFIRDAFTGKLFPKTEAKSLTEINKELNKILWRN